MPAPIYSTGKIVLTASETESLRILGVGEVCQIYKGPYMEVAFKRHPLIDGCVVHFTFVGGRTIGSDDIAKIELIGKNIHGSEFFCVMWKQIKYSSCMGNHITIDRWTWGSLLLREVTIDIYDS